MRIAARPNYSLAAALDKLTGRDVEGTHCSRPLVCPPRTLELVRISSVPSRQVEEAPDLVSGLWSLGREIFFALHHRDGELALLLGLHTPLCEDGALARYVRGRRPNSEVSPYPNECLANAVADLPHGIAVLGIPSPEVASLDSLVAGMGAGEWAYLVAAEPMTDAETAASLEYYASEDERLVNSHLRPGTVEASNRPLAKSYHDLLCAAIRLCEEGRQDGMWRVRTFLLADDEASACAGSALLTSALGGPESLPQPIRVIPCSREQGGFADRVPYTQLPSASLSALCALPTVEVPGFRIRLRKRFGQNTPPRGSRPVELGRLLPVTTSQPNSVSLDADALTRHLFISGTTGSGKTETTKSLLAQLWREHRVPFLVLEPAKRDYRDLRAEPGLRDLLVFTLGDETEAPFRLNPLEVPPSVPVQTHIDLVRTLFRATFAGLYPPLPYLLEQALVESYQINGWDLARDVGGCGRRSPTLDELRGEADRVASRAGYGRELEQNVRAALGVRLGSLLLGGKGKMLNTPSSVPFNALVQRPVVLELASIGDPEIVSFLIGALLVRLYEHLFFGSAPAGKHDNLRHVTVLEEAHRLLAAASTAPHSEASSIQSHAVEAFCRLLCEVRAHGEGVVVVDQSPAKLHPDVLRGTNTKLVHRLVAEDDRQAAGAAMNMTKDQVRALATLSVGEAAYFPELVDEPLLVLIDPRERSGERDPLGVEEHMAQFYRDHPKVLAPHLARPSVRESRGEFGNATTSIARDVETLILSTPPDDLWPALAAHLKRCITMQPRSGGSGDLARQALELGLAVRDQLLLSPQTRAEYRSRLAAVLFAPEEDK